MESNPTFEHIHRQFLTTYRIRKNEMQVMDELYSRQTGHSFKEWMERLTTLGVADGLVYMDRSVSAAEFRSMLQTAAYPFLYLTSNGIPAFINEPVSDPDKLLQGAQLSDGGVPVISAFPIGTEEDTFHELASGNRHPFFKLTGMLKQERSEIFHILIYAVFIGIIGLSLPLGVQSLVGFIASGQLVTSAYILIFFILAGILLSGIMTIFQLEVVERLQQKLFARTAFSFANRVPKIKMESVLKYYPPELMNRFFDTLTLQKGIPTLLIDLPSAVFQAVFGIVLLSLYHPLFIVLGIVLSMVLYAVLRFTGKKAIATALEESEYKYKVANWLEEIARAITTFKLAGHSALAIEKTDRYVGGYIRARESHFSILRTQYYSFVVFKILITAVLLLLGLTLMLDRQLNLGQFVAAEIVIIMIMNSIEKIILKVDDVYDVMAGVEKISKISGFPMEQQGSLVLPVAPGEGMEVSFKSVSYTFPEKAAPVLNDLSIDVNAGERICITGANGSGKSTLLQILLGIYNPSSGTVAYNGVPLRNIDKAALMNRVGNYVSQDTLFDGTVLENITMGRHFLRNEDVFWAIEAAGLSGYIESLPEGLSTRLIGGAARISESNAHKLIMARNLAERPSLFVVDDFLLGVERTTKQDILELLVSKSNSWTVIMASNDPMVMRAVDRIVLLEQGRIKATGTFDQLYDCGFLTQLDGGEKN